MNEKLYTIRDECRSNTNTYRLINKEKTGKVNIKTEIHLFLRNYRESINKIKIKKLITITPKFLCIVIYCYRV